MSNKSSPTWILAPLLLQLLPLTASAATIKVPLQQPTIQAAIDNAVAGDVIQVSPGTYNENINFNGKAISVIAVRGPRLTTINGTAKGPVVTFASGEGLTSVLNGFVITKGSGGLDPTKTCFLEGGGICVSNSSPTIEYNTIRNNNACEGAGIAIDFGSPLVTGNLITNNVQGGCSGGTGGGGILIGGAASARIVNNIIENNSMDSADGGGIALFAAGTPSISGNIIRSNSTSVGCSGGGISMVNQSDANITGNQITNNSSDCGGGVYWLVPSGARGPFLVNNTISDNTGAGVYADGFDASSRLINNIIVGTGGQAGLYCGNFNDTNPPIIRFNDIFAASGGSYGGLCTDQTGTNGNISASPLFASATDQNYHLKIGSPAIDAGNNSAPNLPTTDFDGAARIQDGNLDTKATVDMGIDEFTPTQAAMTSASSPAGGTENRMSHKAQGHGQSASRFRTTGSDSRSTVVAYDLAGHIISQTDANGRKQHLK